MANSKVDLTKLSINQLETLTGVSYRKIKKILADIPPAETTDNAIFYKSREALCLIFESQIEKGSGESSSEKLDAIQEKAKLDKLKAELVELQVQERKGILVPSDLVEKTWSDRIIAFRQKVLGIPNRVAAPVAAISDPREIERKLDAVMREALSELSLTRSNENAE